MTTSWAVAPAGRPWRQVDPLLEVAAPFVDAEAVLGGVHQVRWDPDRRTRIAFDRADGDVVVLEITPEGVKRTRLADDRSLSGLDVIFDPTELAVRLGEILSVPVGTCALAMVSYRPGSRCVLRADVTTPSGTHRLFIKVLAGGVQRYVEANLALTTLGNAHGNPNLVPPILAAWTDIDAVVSAAVSGRTASDLLHDEREPVKARETLAGLVGNTLAVVHQTPADPVFSEHPWTCADELAKISDYLPAAWHADPMTAPSLTWLMQALTESCPGNDAPTTFSHGSFRTGQILVNPEGLTVLDLDGAGTADPARDLGNAMAYLAWKNVRRDKDEPSTHALDDALHDGYLAGGGIVDEDALAWWQAAAITKIAGRRYRSLHTSQWPQLPELLRVAEELLERSDSPATTPTPASAPHRGRGRALTKPDMADPAHLTAVLKPLLAQHAMGSSPVTIRDVHTLRVARGRRVVVRCKVTGMAPKPEFIVVKDYAETWRARTTYENLVHFSIPLDPRSNVDVPVPLGVLPDLGIVAYREAVGRSMTDLEEDVALRVARRAGLWLQAIHTSDFQLGRHVDLDRELGSVDEWAHEIGHAHASLVQPALDLARSLHEAATRLPDVANVPIHKDFHPGHVLRADDASVTVIDLDEARMGDPAIDVAHMSAYAEELDLPWAEGIRDGFLDGYGELPGEAPDTRLGFYAAYTRLKMAKQRVRAASVAQDLDTATAKPIIALLARGVACLDG